MGFFSGLFGGQKTNVPATGLYALPQELQGMYKDILSQSQNALLPGGNLNVNAFTPLPQTAQETQGLNMISNGVTPTPESLQADLAMLMNPYDESVIGGINREAQGQNSLVNQAGMQAGQQGSNRNFLATSDVEQNRLNNIGQFRQGQYNTAINNILGPLSQLKQQDIGNLFGAGQFQRGLDTQTKQAPYTALSSTLSPLSTLMQQGQGTPAQTVKTGGGISGLLGGISNIAGLAGTLSGLPSMGGGFFNALSSGLNNNIRWS